MAIATLTPMTAPPPDVMLPLPMRVRDYRQETHDTFTLVLDAAGEVKNATRSLPGQFNMLYVFAVGEAAISLSGDCEEPGVWVHTIRSVGSVTAALSRLRPGQVVGVRGPFGSAWPIEAARGQDVVVVSGGIGLAPLRPTIYYIFRHRGDFGRVILLHGVRTPADNLFADELTTWSRRGDIQVLVTADRGDPSWTGRVGVVTNLFSEVGFDPERTVGFICGPEIMMKYSVLEFDKRGVPHDRMYVSMERNMQCAVGLCGHCQFGPSFVCRDGPVFRFDKIEPFFHIPEI